MHRRGYRRVPYYQSDIDYTTNAPSYYDTLGRFVTLIKELTDRLNNVENTFVDIVHEWVLDGTFETILENLLLSDYAKEDWVTTKLGLIINDIEQRFIIQNQNIADFEDEISHLETDLQDELQQFKLDINEDFDTYKNVIDSSIDTLTNDLEQRRINVKSFGAVGDGITNDYLAFQTVLNLAENFSSVRVYVPNGRYKLQGELEIHSDTDILVADNAYIFRDHNGYMVLNGERGANYSGYDGRGNIRIKGGTWDVNGHNYLSATGFAFGHGKNIHISNLSILNVKDSHAIEINGCKNVYIKECKFKGFFNPANDRTFSEAIQLDIMKNSGVFNAFGAYDSTPCKNIWIEDNLFDRSDETGFWGRGVGSHTATATKQQHNINITGNVFIGTLEWAVRSYNWEYVNISNNKIIDCSGGINHRASITGIYTQDPQGNQFGSERLWGVNITDNIIQGGLIDYRGIEVYGENDGSSKGRVSGVNVTGNFIRPHTSSQSDSILFNYVSGCTCSNNYIKESGHESISIKGESIDIAVTGNSIISSGRTAIRVYDDSHNISIANNVIRLSHFSGIQVTDVCVNISILGNTIIGVNGIGGAGTTYNHIRLSQGVNLGSIVGNVLRDYSTTFVTSHAIYVTNTTNNITTAGNVLVGFELYNASVTNSTKSSSGDLHD